MLTESIDDAAVGSVVSSYADMNSTAQTVISQCVAHSSNVGGTALVDADWERPRLIVHVFAQNEENPDINNAVQSTIAHSMQDNYKNKELWLDENSFDLDEELSSADLEIWGHPGQGSSADPENTFGQAYCNVKATDWCWPGWNCDTMRVAEVAKTVVWGFAKEKVVDFVGMCALEVGS